MDRGAWRAQSTGSQSDTTERAHRGLRGLQSSAPGTAPGRALSPGRNSSELISWTQSLEAPSGGGVGAAGRVRPGQRAWLSAGASRALRAEGRAWLLSPEVPGLSGSRERAQGGGHDSDPEPDCMAPDGPQPLCAPEAGCSPPTSGTVRPRCPAASVWLSERSPCGAGHGRPAKGAVGGQAPSRTLICLSVSQPGTLASTRPAHLPWPHSRPLLSPLGWSLCDPAPALSCHGNYYPSKHLFTPGPHCCPLLGLPTTLPP